jgi:hypothetical protein
MFCLHTCLLLLTVLDVGLLCSPKCKVGLVLHMLQDHYTLAVSQPQPHHRLHDSLAQQYHSRPAMYFSMLITCLGMTLLLI